MSEYYLQSWMMFEYLMEFECYLQSWMTFEYLMVSEYRMNSAKQFSKESAY